MKFLGLVLVLTVLTGMAVHFGLEIPWFSHWIGQLPGDLIIKKNGLSIYLPITSSVLIGAVLSLSRLSK